MEEFQGTSRFEVLSYLGEGTMGVVYCCLDRERNENVAVKTLRRLDGEALFRFKNEFRAVQDIEHPNLVSLGELIETSGSWFFSMELIEGGDFLSYVRPRAMTSPGGYGSFTPLLPEDGDESWRPHTACNIERLRSALRQLAQGLVALHNAGQVHRDIKPSNVMVAHSGRVVILDFGFVTAVQPDAPEREIVGTAAYMAPEQAAVTQVGPAADWYAMGAVLFESLVGRPPIEGMPWEVLMAKQHRRPEPPSSFVDGVPPDLDALCASLLAIEPGDRPTGAEVLAALGGDPSDRGLSAAAGSMSIPMTEFVGRRGELEELLQAFADAGHDHHAVSLFVLGESGIGKSALVERFAEEIDRRAGGDAPVVLFGRCHERESVPYKAFDGVIDALSRFLMEVPGDHGGELLPESIGLLSEIFPVLRRAEIVARRLSDGPQELDPAELRSQVFACVRELFVRLSRRHRVVVIIDDLHWADGDSLALLMNLLRGPDEPAILFLATVRTTPGGGQISPSSPMATLRRVLSSVREVHLEGLSMQDATRLAQTLFRRLAPERADIATGVVAESGGHPLFIDEMIRFLLASGATALDSLRLEDALWTRISTLEPGARDVLELVAVAGLPIKHAVLASAAQMSVGECARWVGLLRVANLVRSMGTGKSDRIEIFHDRVRTAVIANLDGGKRRHCHERLALAFEMSRGERSETLAMHWRGAGDRVRSYRYLLRAAKEAEGALAFDRAARIYRQSIELLPADSREIPEVKRRLGDALANSGRAAESANVYLSAARRHPGSAVELHARAAAQLLRSGHVDSGLEVLRKVLDGLGMTMPESSRGALVSLLAQRTSIRMRGLRFRERPESKVPDEDLTRTDISWAVSVGLGFVDTIRGAEFQARHLRLALKTGEPYRVARALSVEVGYRYTVGQKGAKSAEKVLAMAKSLAERLDRPHIYALNDLMAGIGAVCEGRWTDAIRLCQSAERILRGQCHNVSWETNSARIMALWGRWYTGALAEIARRVPELISGARSRGDLYAEATYRSYFVPMVLLARDLPDKAATETTRALANWSQRGFHFQHYFQLFAATQVDLYRGEYQAAVDRIHERWAALSRSLLLQVQQNRIEALHFRARSELCLGRQQGDLEMVAGAERAAQKIRRESTGWGDGLADLVRAGVAHVRGQQARCEQLLEQAADLLEGRDMHLYAAAARRQLGRCIGGQRGAELIEQADALFAKERVRNPARMAAMMVPGIWLDGDAGEPE